MCRMLFEMFFPPLMEFAQRFQTARGPLRDIPLPIVLRSFLGLFFSYFITDLIMGSQMPAVMQAGAFDHFVDIYLHGVLAEELIAHAKFATVVDHAQRVHSDYARSDGL